MKMAHPKGFPVGMIGHTTDDIWCYSDDRVFSVGVHPLEGDRVRLFILGVETEHEDFETVTSEDCLESLALAITKCSDPDFVIRRANELRAKDADSKDGAS